MLVQSFLSEICGQNFTHTHHGQRLFCALNDFFEMFFFSGGMIAQHTRLMTLKKKNWVNKFEFNLDFSNPHNLSGSEWASGVFSTAFLCLLAEPWFLTYHTHLSSIDDRQRVCI